MAITVLPSRVYRNRQMQNLCDPFRVEKPALGLCKEFRRSRPKIDLAAFASSRTMNRKGDGYTRVIKSLGHRSLRAFITSSEWVDGRADAGAVHRGAGHIRGGAHGPSGLHGRVRAARSEEHTSELQSPCNLV